jgi:HPt (histidine-containing phosphotransfer) domain-containing protein
LQEIRHRFVSGLLQNLARIRNAELSENWIDVREVVHKMAGSAGLLGYTQLSDKARDAEIAIKRGDTPLLAGMIDDLEREVRRIVGNAGATDNNAREAH